MIRFVIEVVIMSIVVSSISYGLKLVPKYPRIFHRRLVQVLNTLFLSLLLTYLYLDAIEPGWVVLGSLIFMCLFLAIIVTNFIAKYHPGHFPPSPPPPAA